MLRLLVRVQNHIIMLLSGTRETKARGTTPSPAVHAELERLRNKIDDILWQDVHGFFECLEGWANKALDEQDSESACIVMAHLALMCKNLERERLSYREASTLLVAHCYLNQYYPWDIDAQHCMEFYARHALLSFDYQGSFEILLSFRVLG